MAVQFEHVGSLITVAGENRCLGHLMDFRERGVFEPTLGRVDILPADAETHNRLLDEALIKGLDDNCAIGMGGTFYATRDQSGRMTVTTWGGTLVSDNLRVAGQVLTFRRGGKAYRGRLQKDADCFNFRRVK